MRGHSLLLAGLLLGVSAFAQQSDSFKLEEQTFNAAGHPHRGVVMSSAGFRITLDSLGDTVSGAWMGSTSYRIEGGFTAAYPPPSEVRGLAFFDFETLGWQPESSVGDYALYGGSLGGLPDDYGFCKTDVDGETVVVDDEVSVGECVFYLVTARNRLGEEGTKGFRSSGAERPNEDACP